MPLTRPPLGTRPETQACALTGNQTSDPGVCRPGIQSTEPYQPGQSLVIMLWYFLVVLLKRYSEMGRALNWKSEGLRSLTVLVTVGIVQLLMSVSVVLKLFAIPIHQPEVTYKWKVWHEKKTSRNLFPRGTGTLLCKKILPGGCLFCRSLMFVQNWTWKGSDINETFLKGIFTLRALWYFQQQQVTSFTGYSLVSHIALEFPGNTPVLGRMHRVAKQLVQGLLVNG